MTKAILTMGLRLSAARLRRCGGAMPCALAVLATTVLAAVTFAAPASAERKVLSRADLEYGTVLFQYYQEDYFNGLIEQAVAAALDNPRALDHEGQLLKGSMALSYGMPDAAYAIFERLLAAESDEHLRNRTWYQLAKLYHSRAELPKAQSALDEISGEIPPDLGMDYHYLSTLVNRRGDNLRQIQASIAGLSSDNPRYPYLLFNLGVTQLGAGDTAAAVDNLAAVVAFGNRSEELEVLADRARHGLAQIAIQEQRLADAWLHLQDIRTEGLYSNRALLAYAWTAIRQDLLTTALPALNLLNRRSIALPEVQQGKVLLGHVHEKQGSMTRALRSHLQAEKDFLAGLEQLKEAYAIVDRGQLPRELTDNIDAVSDPTGWESAERTRDYQILAPFLVDLLASNAFHQVHRDLSELYTIHDNLSHWARQTDQHQLVLQNADAKVFDDSVRQAIADSAKLQQRLATQRKEMGMLRLTLEVSEQNRFDALLENAQRELEIVNDKLFNLQARNAPYRQPASYPATVKKSHQRIAEKQRETERYIARLEPIMRDLVKAELKKHEERMNYYLAQTRLAKARLYDAALMNTEREEPAPQRMEALSDEPS
jgi:hypothetical protein